MALILIFNFSIIFLLTVCIIIINFAGSTAVSGSFYGRASGLLYITSVHCSGTERKLTDCPLVLGVPALTACGDGQHAGVRCIGKEYRIVL